MENAVVVDDVQDQTLHVTTLDLGALRRSLGFECWKVRLSPFQHLSPTVSGAAYIRSSSPLITIVFPLLSHPRVVLELSDPPAPDCTLLSRVPRSRSSYQVPCEGRLSHPTVGPSAHPQFPKGTTNRPLSCVRWPFIRAFRWFLSRAALGRWLYCRMLPVCFLRNGMPYSDSFLVALIFVDIRSLSLPG